MTDEDIYTYTFKVICSRNKEIKVKARSLYDAEQEFHKRYVILMGIQGK